MPEHDPNRFVEAVLADPSHKVPLPDRGYRLFSADGEKIDLGHPFYAGLIADGSLVLKPEPAADPAAEKKSDPPKLVKVPTPLDAKA